MPVKRLRILPGVDLQSTPTLNQTQWAATQLVRFYKGLIQKLGGWMHYSATPVIGTCRALLGWADLYGNTYLAAATEQRLQVYIGGTPTDITPIVATTNPAVAFYTTSSSATVAISDTQAPNVGDWINLVTQVSVGGIVLVGYYQVQSVGSNNYTVSAASQATSTVSGGGTVPEFTTTLSSASVEVTLANHGQTAMTSTFSVPIPVTVGGITLSGTYTVQTVIDTGHFTITAASAATSVASVYLNGGDAQISYLLPSGAAENTFASGYGVGDYGAGDWGLANNTTTSDVIPMRIWSLDHFGQDLVGAPNGGQIYYWQPGTAVAAQRVSNTSPAQCNWIFVVPEVQILMALGAESGGTQYPLLARWCDASDFTDWTPTVSNQAGSYQLNNGSKLLFGAANGLTLYLWTDFGVWQVAYQGLPYVFSFTELARDCGAVSSRAVAITSIGAQWLSVQGFFQMSAGGVQPMECPVWDFYTNNVDTTQLAAITSAPNALFHEVAWHFPLAIGGGLMGYVKWNWLENVWDYGTLVRTAWIDFSPAGNPMGVDASGLIQEHEVGSDADGSPMMPFAQTHYFDAQEGDDFVFCDQIIPDFVSSSTGTAVTMSLSVLSQDYPEGTTKQDGPYTVQFNNQSTALPSNFLTTNSRGRQLAFLLSSADFGSSWRLGALRYRFAPDGKI